MMCNDTHNEVMDELLRLAEVTEAILDGEEVKNIITEKALHYVINPHPDHPYLAGDHYDVDHELFLRNKKLLLRVARMSQRDIGATIFVPVAETKFMTVALHNGTCFRYYKTFGQERSIPADEVKQVFETGEIGTVFPDESAAMYTTLAPVRDSLGDVVAVVELSTPTPENNNEAWS